MSTSMINDEELVRVLNPFASSASTARLELPRRARARAPLVPLALEAPHAPRNGRRERPSIALRRQRQRHNRQLFRQSPLSINSPTFMNLMSQKSNASVSVEEEQEPEQQQTIVRTLSF
jgi:hypothetical protein